MPPFRTCTLLSPVERSTRRREREGPRCQVSVRAQPATLLHKLITRWNKTRHSGVRAWSGCTTRPWKHPTGKKSMTAVNNLPQALPSRISAFFYSLNHKYSYLPSRHGVIIFLKRVARVLTHPYTKQVILLTSLLATIAVILSPGTKSFGCFFFSPNSLQIAIPLLNMNTRGLLAITVTAICLWYLLFLLGL